MNPKIVPAVLFLAVVAVAAAAFTIGSSSGSGVESTSGSDPCCFTNPRFTGVCSVTPGEDETCSSILAYLNNPNSTGKAYCGGTTIRGGWAQVDCE